MKYLFVFAGLTVGALTWAAPLEAQFCFRGHPKPECNQFLITEAGLAGGAEGAWLVMSELGFMHNLNETNALGGTVLLAAGDDDHIALNVRYRRWLSSNVTLDASPGVILRYGEKTRAPGFTGHVGVGYGDHLALTLLVQAIPLEGEDTEVRSYLGFRVGSYLSIGAHALGLISLLALAATWED